MSTSALKSSSLAPSVAGADGTMQLHLYGPARLEYQGQNVKLTQRSLALLYYLAIEGPTRRDTLSELLWGFGGARNNLRVELSRLRKVLGEFGLEAFADSPDPLYLPEDVKLHRARRNEQTMLGGLEDLSEDFQYWLDIARGRLAELSSGMSVRQQQLKSLAADVAAPYVLVLSGLPGAGHEEFAKDLARRLGLPFAKDSKVSTHAALNFLTRHSERSKVPSDTVMSDQQSVWVLEHLTFGEDPILLLELREKYPPERLKFVELKPLHWLEVRDHLLGDLPFNEAAQIYIESEGNVGFLKELLALRPPEGFGDVLPLPQRVRATYLLKTHELSMQARLVLEPLSVHPGALSEELVRALGAEPSIDELEREGWLRYQGGWHLINNTARRVFYEGLHQGRRKRFHRVAAEQFGSEGNELAQHYHLELCRRNASNASHARLEAPREATKNVATPVKSSEIQQRTSVGKELVLLEQMRSGADVEGDDTRIALVKRDPLQDRVYIRWELPDEPCVLHLKGRAYHKNMLSPNAVPEDAQLELTVYGKETRQVTFTSAQQTGALHDTQLTLPLPNEFEYWFNVDEGRELQLATFSNPAVIEFELRAYRSMQSQKKDEAVKVYDLNALPSMKITHQESQKS